MAAGGMAPLPGSDSFAAATDLQLNSWFRAISAARMLCVCVWGGRHRRWGIPPWRPPAGHGASDPDQPISDGQPLGGSMATAVDVRSAFIARLSGARENIGQSLPAEGKPQRSDREARGRGQDGTGVREGVRRDHGARPEKVVARSCCAAAAARPAGAGDRPPERGGGSRGSRAGRSPR